MRAKHGERAGAACPIGCSGHLGGAGLEGVERGAAQEEPCLGEGEGEPDREARAEHGDACEAEPQIGHDADFDAVGDEGAPAAAGRAGEGQFGGRGPGLGEEGRKLEQEGEALGLGEIGVKRAERFGSVRGLCAFERREGSFGDPVDERVERSEEIAQQRDRGEEVCRGTGGCAGQGNEPGLGLGPAAIEGEEGCDRGRGRRGAGRGC